MSADDPTGWIVYLIMLGIFALMWVGILVVLRILREWALDFLGEAIARSRK